MALIITDRVLESSTTTGTGVFTLAGAVLGFRSFASAMSVSDTCWYYIEGVDSFGKPTGEYEYGLGTYSAANQLTRTTVRGSSNGGAAVNFTAGSKLVGISPIAPSTDQVRSEWRSALKALKADGPTFSAYRSASGDTVARTTFVKVNFDSELWDTASGFASSKFTPGVDGAGYYQINAVVELAAAVPGFAAIYKNGVEYKRGARSTLAGAGTNFFVSGLVYLDATDYVEIFIYHDHTVSTTLIGGPSLETWFDGHFVRGV